MDYNDIKKIAKDTAGDIKNTSLRLYKSAKISMDITKKKNGLDEKFYEIGRLIYKSHCGKETDNSRISAICEEIDMILAEIRELEDTKNILKANKKCDVCGCLLNPEDITCPNCGCELD